MAVVEMLLLLAMAIPTTSLVDASSLLDAEAEKEWIAKRKQLQDKSGVFDLGIIRNVEEIYNYMDELKQNYTNIVTVESIGKSYEKREQKLVKIGSTTKKNKPAVFFNGLIHAREWLTGSTMVYIVDKLTSQYGKDAETTRLVDELDFYVLPVFNVDGYAYSWTYSRMWRKTRSCSAKCEYPDWGLSDCSGADANRNFDYKFNTTGVSTLPCDNNFPGVKPFSEPVTRNVKGFLLQHRHAIKAYVDIHSFGQLWLIPYAYSTDVRPEHEKELMDLANRAVDAVRSVNGRTYQAARVVPEIGETSGTTTDWAYAVAGIKYSYTIELPPRMGAGGGNDGFLTKEDTVIPIAKEVFTGLKVVCDQVLTEEFETKETESQTINAKGIPSKAIEGIPSESNSAAAAVLSKLIIIRNFCFCMFYYALISICF